MPGGQNLAEHGRGNERAQPGHDRAARQTVKGPRRRNDDELQDWVRDELFWDPKADSGLVTLTGTAAWQYQREEAGFVAGNVPGVADVDNQIAQTTPQPKAGPARRHPAGTAGQPGAPGDRLDRRVGYPVLAAWPAATAAHGDLTMAGARRHGRSAAQAALAGGSLRRHAGQRSVAARGPLLCVPSGRLADSQSAEDVTVATTRRLVDVIRQGPPLPASDVDRATTRALALLRPAV
jgi:hypothetical protein